MTEEKLALVFSCGGLTLASSACGDASTPSAGGTAAGPTGSAMVGGSSKVGGSSTAGGSSTVGAVTSRPKPCGPLGEEQTIEDVRAHAVVA